MSELMRLCFIGVQNKLKKWNTRNLHFQTYSFSNIISNKLNKRTYLAKVSNIVKKILSIGLFNVIIYILNVFIKSRAQQIDYCLYNIYIHINLFFFLYVIIFMENYRLTRICAFAFLWKILCSIIKLLKFNTFLCSIFFWLNSKNNKLLPILAIFQPHGYGKGISNHDQSSSKLLS